MDKCPLTEANQLKKDVRGKYDYHLDRHSGMLAVHWNDNNVMTLVSNCFSIEPVTQIRRWPTADKKHVQILMPNMIVQYNHFMGGTDRMDLNIAKFRINICIKKWWWALFCRMPGNYAGFHKSLSITVDTGGIPAQCWNGLHHEASCDK